MSDVSVVIVGSKRTAIGSFLGQFTGVPTPKLGATAIRAALEQSGVAPADVSEVLMGCVLPANLGQAPARQAALGADLPASTGCTTINKVCGSGIDRKSTRSELQSLMRISYAVFCLKKKKTKTSQKTKHESSIEQKHYITHQTTYR